MAQTQSEISLEKMELINKTIIELYDTTVPIRDRINRFFHSFMNIVYFDRASVLFFCRTADGTYSKKSSISVNWNEKYVEKYNDYYCHLDDTLPVLDQPCPIIFRSSSFFNQEIRSKTEYWQHYLLPNNSVYEVAGNLQINYSDSTRASYAFYRGDKHNDFSDQELCIIKMFQPLLSGIFREEKAPVKNVPSRTALDTFERYNSIGLCILNDAFQPIHKSGIFEEMNKRSDNSIMQHILHLCINLSQKKNEDLNSPLEYKPENEPVYLEVTAIEPSSETEGKRYCCIAYDLSHFLTRTLEQARTTYSLTNREFEILQRVIRGQKNEAIAKELYLSVPSIKKNLASIYSKLDITNQKQILSRLCVL